VIRTYQYHCHSCNREWTDHAQKPDRDGWCPYCWSTLYTFQVIPDEPEEQAA
jgi:DNA-directed RNA polymerase subunit RPC12/RpoP